MTKPRILRELATLPAHAEAAWNVAWNPKLSLLASCSTDRDVRLYTYKSLPSGISDKAETVFSLNEVIPSGHKRTVRSLAWSPSGEILATASFDSTVGVWERIPENFEMSSSESGPDWECYGTLEGHESECKCVSFSHNGHLLASCGRDKSVWVWEMRPDSDFECVGVLIEHSQDVKAVQWHPKEEVSIRSIYTAAFSICIVRQYH